MSDETLLAKLHTLFQTLGVHPRLEILLAIGTEEVCVCHLETVLGYRQAYISQHLMALREANLLETQREGRFVYYRLSNPQILDLIVHAGKLLDLAVEPEPQGPSNCTCPRCTSLIQGS